MINLTFAATSIVAALVLIGGILLLKRTKINMAVVMKTLGVALFSISFIRYLYEEPAVYSIIGLDSSKSPFNANGIHAAQTGLGVILIWFSYAAILTTVVAAFFDNKTLRRIVNLFSLPCFAAILVAFKTYSIATVGTDRWELSTPRLWIMAVEIGIALAMIVGHMIIEKNIEIPRGGREIGMFFYALVFAILAIMPNYVPEAFISNINLELQIYDLTPEHRIVLYGAVILPVLAYLLLRNNTRETNRMVLIYMSLAFMWAYIGLWELPELMDVANWPLHLCNLAMFLVPLCLIFKMKRLYNFCLFINVIGALFAMLMPHELRECSAIGTDRISYWLNHYAAFGMPVLVISLKIFERPKVKQWLYSLAALVVYYSAMLFTNAYLTERDGEVSDFFFTNSDFIVSKLGTWAEKTRDFTVTINVNGYDLVFYPIYQVIFIGVYLLLSVGVWFLYSLLFTAIDKDEDRSKREKDYKRMKKDLKKYLGGKPETASITGNEEPSLVLRNFSKRYGSNKHYSVNNVSFEVKGGEIFGFLGPNGAGKSTIIKSMVGIQTITSGNIEICGFDVEKQPVAAKMNTAFVPDHYALYENLTGREYINYIADLFGVSKEDRDAFMDEYVDVFQLTGAIDNQMKTYSHGMKQKITIMSALVHNPKVWILDEPLTGLDPTSIHEVKECMKRHAAKGNIVFFSSHIIDVVEKLCDKIAIIKKGQLRAYKSMQELNEEGIELEQFYLDIIYDGNDEHVPFVEEAVNEEANA